MLFWITYYCFTKLVLLSFPFFHMLLILPSFFFSAAIMTGYAQLMKKTSGMTKKGKKRESPAQNLVRELSMDHGVQPHGVSSDPNAIAEDVATASPEVQAVKKRKLILRDRQKSPIPTSQELETTQAASHNEIPISEDEEIETVG
jgi:hypothetical protein